MNCIKKFWEKHKLNNVIFFLFYMLVCFPFVGVNVINSDTQPWALLMAIGIVLYYWLFKGVWYSNTYTKSLLLFLMYCMVVGLLSIANMSSFSSLIRSGANYATVFFVTIATYYIMKEQNGLKEKWVKTAIWIWFVVGFVQKFIYSEFGYSVLSNARTMKNRGVISLASEPSFYGYMCIFLAVFAFDFIKFRTLYVMLCLVQIIFFANSTVSIMYLVVFVIAYVVVSIAAKEPKGYVTLVSFAVFGILLYEAIPSLVNRFHNRSLALIYNMFYNWDELMGDNSVTLRLMNITDSIEGMVEWWGLPHGFSSTRIQSGYGAMAYELGIIGIVMLILFFVVMVNNRMGVVVAIGITAMLFSAVQLANPLFSFYVGYCMYKKSVRNQRIEGERKYGKRNPY